MRPTSALITLTLLLLAIPTGLVLAPLLATATATAAQPAASAPAPRIVSLAVHGEPDGSGGTVYRLWDDGLIEQNRRECAGCPWLGWFVVSGD